MGTTDQYPDIEAVLRGELAVRADSLSIGAAPYPAVARAARHDRYRRRVGAATALVLAVVLAIVIPFGAGGLMGTSAGPPATGGGPSPLLNAPVRGDLAGDSALITAAEQRFDAIAAHSPTAPGPHATAGYRVIYANDDGTHRVIIGATYDGSNTDFTGLVGPNAAAVSSLKPGIDESLSTPANTYDGGAPSPESTFTYLGMFTGGGGSVPFVVLGPTTMTQVEYSTTPTLGSMDGKLTHGRSGITHVTTVDGAAAGEIADATTVAGAVRLGSYTVFRAELAGRLTDVDPMSRTTVVLPDSSPTSDAQHEIRAAVAERGQNAGLVMPVDGVGGNGVPDRVAQALSDLASFDGVSISSIHYSIDWVGQETAQWNAALLDVSAPGLPKLQIFVRGLTVGASENDSSGMPNTLMRPAVTLTAGHLPTTGEAFGGTLEPNLIGFGLMNEW